MTGNDIQRARVISLNDKKYPQGRFADNLVPVDPITQFSEFVVPALLIPFLSLFVYFLERDILFGIKNGYIEHNILLIEKMIKKYGTPM